MKKCIFFSFALLSFGFNTVQATGIVNGWYGGLRGFVSNVSSAKFKKFSANPAPDTPATIAYSIGGGGAGQLGYRCHQFRLEMELLGNYNGINKLTLGDMTIKKKSSSGLKLRGSTIAAAGLINFFFDFNSHQGIGDVSPYVGLGVGVAHLNSELSLLQNKQKIGPKQKASSETLVGQGIVGISYAMDSYTTVGLDFRYLGSRSQKKNIDKYAMQSINILFNVAFDGTTL